MKKLMVEIQLDDEGGYKGHGENTAELIRDGLNNFLKIDLEGDGVIKKGWSVKIIDNNQ